MLNLNVKGFNSSPKCVVSTGTISPCPRVYYGTVCMYYQYLLLLDAKMVYPKMISLIFRYSLLGIKFLLFVLDLLVRD